MLKGFVFPRLSFPFPSRINAFADLIDENSRNWVERYRLAKDSRASARVYASHFGHLAARAYPDAPADRLQIVSDWNTWLFMHDDQCDESGLGKHPDQLANLHERCLGTLAGKTPWADDQALIHALHDIFSRLQPLATTVWMLRFSQSVSEYFEATVWEANNRFYKVWPNTAAYIRMRPYTGGLYTDIDFIEIAEQIALPIYVRSHPCIKRLTSITNNVVCWTNDILSLTKEHAYDDMHNLVLIMQHDSGIDLQEALDRVKKLIDQQVRLFLRFESQLPKFGGTIDQQLLRLVDVLRSWMRGNLDWSYESGRYHNEEISQPIPKIVSRNSL